MWSCDCMCDVRGAMLRERERERENTNEDKNEL